MMKQKKLVKLATIKPNAGIELDYLSALLKMMSKIENDITTQVLKNYKKRQNEIVGDESPNALLNGILRSIYSKWRLSISEISEVLARKTINNVDSTIQKQLQQQIKSKLGVMPDTSSRRALRVKQSSITNNVGLIKSIPERYLDSVEVVVNQAMMGGKDSKWLSGQLRELSGVTKRRATIIARDQIAKATAAISQERAIAAGFDKAEWNHSDAGKTQRASHVAADGEVFDLDKGMYLDGEWVLPGEEINCRCFYTIVYEM